MAGIDPGVHFFLIGDGPEKGRLVQLVQERSAANITFLAPVPKDEVGAVLKEAELLLHCLKTMEVLKYGVSPNKLYDYLASGKPVIMVSNASNQIIREAGAGLVVEPNNAQALVWAFSRLKKCLPKKGSSWVLTDAHMWSGITAWKFWEKNWRGQ